MLASSNVRYQFINIKEKLLVGHWGKAITGKDIL